MGRFPLIEQANQSQGICGLSAANTVGKYAGTVPRGNGIQKVSKTERRQTNTQRTYRKEWIEAKLTSPRGLLWQSL
jgi:hypothetical protein